MTSKVAAIRFDGDYFGSLKQALDLIGGIGHLNTKERNVVIKVGIFNASSPQHSSVGLVKSIADNFNKAPKVFLTESDSYCGKALDRLQIYKHLFTEHVVPFSLSNDTVTRNLTVGGEQMNLSHVMFKPNVFIDTHVLRSFPKGSILKNLFGCTPTAQKAKYHKNEIFCRLIADIYEAIGGIDLAVLDGTHLFHSGTEVNVRTNALMVGKDAVAVEAVACKLAGLNPEKMDLLKEFIRRGLGEGNLDEIEVVGTPIEELEESFKIARKELKARYNSRPRAPGISSTIDKLTAEGWMDKPKTVPEVVNELRKRGVINAKDSVVGNTLRRRSVAPERTKALERTKDKGEWVYRRKKE